MIFNADRLQITEKKYTRDRRSPIPKNSSVSKVMSANKAKNTKPEITLRKQLWKFGLRGFRIHCSKLPGKPDIAYVSKRIAIFVHGCFWHRCPYCKNLLPNHNSKFWKNKFENNIKRDINKREELERLNWKVITVWECEIKNSFKLNFKTLEIKSSYGKTK